MPRFFLVQENVSIGKSIILSSEESHHLKVMRLMQGDTISLGDASGSRYKAEITHSEKAKAVVKILSREDAPQRWMPKITLGQAIPRYKKMEFILQKTTELGIACISPIKTARSFHPAGNQLNKNRWARWTRIIAEAAKQSGRIDIPALTPLYATLDSFLGESYSPALKFCLWEGETQDKSLRDILGSFKRPESIVILIGPEGGFSPEEIDIIKTAGYYTLLCGPRILRVETAAMIFMALCQYIWGDF